MNKNASDFMITEYDKIATAYFGLRDQINEWFKAYLALIGLPLTVLAAVSKIESTGISGTLTELPEIVAGLLVLVSFLGLFVTLSIVSMRLEMILYARTINGVRRYFGELDNKLVQYLILPTSDANPPFYEAGQAIFWQVMLLGFLDGIILSVAFLNLTKVGWIQSLAVGLIFLLLHWIVYRVLACRREKKWKTRFSNNINQAQY